MSNERYLQYGGLWYTYDYEYLKMALGECSHSVAVDRIERACRGDYTFLCTMMPCPKKEDECVSCKDCAARAGAKATTMMALDDLLQRFLDEAP